jgi:hypothetical protein
MAGLAGMLLTFGVAGCHLFGNDQPDLSKKWPQNSKQTNQTNQAQGWQRPPAGNTANGGISPGGGFPGGNTPGFSNGGAQNMGANSFNPAGGSGLGMSGQQTTTQFTTHMQPGGQSQGSMVLPGAATGGQSGLGGNFGDPRFPPQDVQPPSNSFGNHPAAGGFNSGGQLPSPPPIATTGQSPFGPGAALPPPPGM